MQLAPFVVDVLQAYRTDRRVETRLRRLPRPKRDRAAGTALLGVLAMLDAVGSEASCELDRWRRLASHLGVSPVLMLGLVIATPAERLAWLREERWN